MEGNYIDNKCPWTSDVSIRGRVFKGVVLSNKMSRTVTLRRDYLHFIKKYNRFEKRHHNLPAHLSPAFARTRIGDVVTVGQCRPLSKTVSFNVIRIEKKRIEGNVRKTFVMFWEMKCFEFFPESACELSEQWTALMHPFWKAIQSRALLGIPVRLARDWVHLEISSVGARMNVLRSVLT